MAVPAFFRPPIAPACHTCLHIYLRDSPKQKLAVLARPPLLAAAQSAIDIYQASLRLPDL